MLTTIREKLTGGIAVAILGLIALTFIFWGVDFGGGVNAYAVKVNGEEVPAVQVQQAIRNQIASYQQQIDTPLSPQLEQRIRDSVIDRFVNERLFDQHAQEHGYRVSDLAVAEEVRALPYFQVDGRFDPETYRRLLSIQGMSSDNFEHQYRIALVRTQLSEAIARTGFVTPAELAQRASLENEQREIGYLQLSMNSFSDAIEPTEEEILARYEAYPERYQTRENASLQYLELTIDMLADQVSIAEQQLRDAYEESLADGRFQTVEERKASHILIAPGDELDEAQAQARAQEVLARAQAGEDFAELAKELSADTVSGENGGDLGWVARNDMVEPFEKALFVMTPGELAGPVKTDFGYHVIALSEVRGGDVEPFEAVRDELERELKARDVENVFFEKRDTLANLVFENLDSLEPAADELGLEVQTIDGVSRNSGPGPASEAAVRRAAFSSEVLDERKNSGVIELAPERVIVVRVSDYTPAQLKPLEQVRESIVQVLKLEGGREHAVQEGEGLAQRARDGESLEALATESGASYKAPKMVKRSTTDMSGEVLGAAFAAPRPGDGEKVTRGLALLGGDYVVYQLSAVQPGALPDGSELQALQQQQAAARGASEFAAYATALREQADVRVALDALTTQDPDQQ